MICFRPRPLLWLIVHLPIACLPLIKCKPWWFCDSYAIMQSTSGLSQKMTTQPIPRYFLADLKESRDHLFKKVREQLIQGVASKSWYALHTVGKTVWCSCANMAAALEELGLFDPIIIAKISNSAIRTSASILWAGGNNLQIYSTICLLGFLIGGCKPSARAELAKYLRFWFSSE